MEPQLYSRLHWYDDRQPNSQGIPPLSLEAKIEVSIPRQSRGALLGRLARRWATAEAVSNNVGGLHFV